LPNLLLGLLSISLGASANEWVRPHSPLDYPETARLTAEVAKPVSGVRVAWVNYEAIKRDFPALKNNSHRQIEAWLLRNFSFIGEDQPSLDNIRNTTIPSDSTRTSKLAYRPEDWKRSAVLEAHDDAGRTLGLVDIKGFGHGAQSGDAVSKQVQRWRGATPEQVDLLRIADHSDGLMSLGEAIAEMTRQQAAQKIFERSQTGFETVESYAILSLPFDIMKDGGKKIPAALYLRQAHEGRNSGLRVPAFAYQDHHGKFQYTSTGSAVDFGGVTFEDPALDSHWGRVDAAVKWDAQKTKPWVWAHDAANAYAKTHDGAIIEAHRQDMLGSVDQWMEKHPEWFGKAMTAQSPSQLARAWSEEHAALPFAERKRQYIDEVARRKPLAGIREALQSKIPTIRLRHGVEPLLGRSDPEALVLLEQALGDSDAWVRAKAVEALGFCQSDAADPILTRLLQHPDPDMRANLATALLYKNDARSFRLLKQLTQDPSPVVRSNAVKALAGHTQSEALDLIAAAQKGTSPRERKAAARALFGRKDERSLSLIETALRDADTEIQMAGLEALRGRSDPKSLAMLLPYLKTNRTPEYREAATKALYGRKDAASLSVIAKLLDDADHAIRQDAIWALIGRHDEGVVALLSRAAQDKDMAVRAAVLRALKGRGDAASLQILEAMLKEPVEWLRSEACLVLGQRTDEAAKALQQKLLADPTLSPGLRGQLRFSLAQRPATGCLSHIVSTFLQP